MSEAHLVHYGLVGRSALITGANLGIGAGIARRLAELGCSVALTYLEPTAANPANPDPAQGHTVTGRRTAEDLVDGLVERGFEAQAVACDITKPTEITRLFDQIGPVQILVNNAAYCRKPDCTGDFDHETAERTFAVNAVGTATISVEFVHRFAAAKCTDGRIISISTDASQSFAYQIAYGASKAAVEALTRSMAVEVGPLGITVNAVAPGPVQTGYIGEDDEKRLVNDIPLRRIGTPDDIANAVAFLASRQANWITGQILRVSGGHEI